MQRDSGSGGFSSLVSAVLEKQTLSAAAVWQLLLEAQEAKSCPLNLLVEEIRREPGADAFFRAGKSLTSVVALPLLEITVSLARKQTCSPMVVFHIPTIRSKD